MIFIWQPILTHGTMGSSPLRTQGNVGFPLVLQGEMGNRQNSVLVDLLPCRPMGIRAAGH